MPCEQEIPSTCSQADPPANETPTAGGEYLPCYFRTSTGEMSTRLIQIDGQKLYFCQDQKTELVNKLEIDLRTALVVLGLPTRT